MKINNYLFNNKIKLSYSVLLTTISSILNVGIAYLTYYIIEIAQNGTTSDALMITIGIFLYLFASGIIEYFSTRVKVNIIQNGISQLKKDLMHCIMSKNYNKFSQTSFSEYTSMYINDLNMIENEYFQGIFSLIYYCITFGLALVSMIYLNIYVTIWIFIMIVIVIKLPTLLLKKQHEITDKYTKQNAMTLSSIKDIIYSYSFTRSKEARSYLMHKNDMQITKNHEIKKEMLLVKKLVGIMSNTSAWSMSLTTFSVCAYFVITGKMNIASVIAVAQLMGNLSYPLISISEINSSMKSLKPIIEKLEDQLQEEAFIKDEDKFIFENKIILKDVSFSYDNKQVFKHLNLEFEKNKKYLILGESGCGKSTLLKLINHFYDINNGKILIDEQLIQNYSDSEIDNVISYMAQDVYLIHDTIKNNITLLDPTYTDEQIRKVIQICGLNKIIENLPNKENEIVKENGINFSGGERQRIALARVLIRNTQVLLLDEFSSALDELNATEIENILLNLKDITLFNVSHKINDINFEKYDAVIYFNHQMIEILPANEKTKTLIKQKNPS